MTQSFFPQHVAIIPDGNRRWAKKKGLPLFEGHRVGAEKTVRDLLKAAQRLNIHYLTFWALSTENLINRSSIELQALFELLRNCLNNYLPELQGKGVKLGLIGDLSKLPADLVEALKLVKEKTKNNVNGVLTIGLNYGGRDEIIRAIKKINPSEINLMSCEKMNQYLDTADLPDPDLIIRTGGELRLSGFLPWQSVYSELYFTPVYFPDFTSFEFEKAIADFRSRQRRFGK